MRTTDEELLTAVREGSRTAWGELFARHAEVAWRTAFAIVHDHARAEDVVQDSFVRAIRAEERFDRQRPFRPWLLRIVTNRAVDVLRHEQFATPGEIDRRPVRRRRGRRSGRASGARSRASTRPPRGGRAALLARPVAGRDRRPDAGSRRHGLVATVPCARRARRVPGGDSECVTSNGRCEPLRHRSCRRRRSSRTRSGWRSATRCPSRPRSASRCSWSTTGRRSGDRRGSASRSASPRWPPPSSPRWSSRACETDRGRSPAASRRRRP